MSEQTTVDSHAEINLKARKGITTLQIRQFVLQGFQLGTGIALARLLTPEEFGVYAISTFLVGMISNFSNFGLSASLIQQKQEITDHDLRVGFTAQLGLLSLIALIGMGATPFISVIYPHANSDLVWLVRAFILLLLLSPLRTTPVLRLERNLEFSKLALLDIVEAVSFQASAVACAFSGLGVWSFVIASLVRGVFGLALAYWLAPWRPGFAWDAPLIRRLVRYGIGFQAQSLVNDISGWATPLLAGSMLGPGAVGFLTWASSNGKRPLILVESVMRVAFPHISRIQDSPSQVRQIVGGYLRWILPACGLWLVLSISLGHPMTLLVYLPKWLPGLPFLQLFAAGLLFDVLNWVVGVTGNALGMTKRVAIWVAVKSIFSVGLTLCLITWIGKAAIPVAWLIASSVSGIGILLLVQKRIGSLVPELLLGSLPSLVVASILVFLQLQRGFEWLPSIVGLLAFLIATWYTLPNFKLRGFWKPAA